MVYKRILVALAGRENEGPVIHEAVRLADALGAELRATHVNAPKAGKPSMKMDTPPLTTEEDIRNQFRRAGFDALADEIDVLILSGYPMAKEIARASVECDLLVVGHRRKNRYLSVLTPSVSKNLTDRVSCPVLVVPRGLAEELATSAETRTVAPVS